MVLWKWFCQTTLKIVSDGVAILENYYLKFLAQLIELVGFVSNYSGMDDGWKR